ncbi:MAG: LEA type 2 family protein [Sedimentisphaerales bacterium]|nr:LEA type 2 family protein [Sedimentisphaerales bacterium]
MRRHLGMCVIIVVAGNLLTGCASLQKALNLEKPRAHLRGVHFDKITLSAVTLLFDVEIENRYALDLPLLNMDYDITSRGEPFLAGQADIQSTIPAKETRTVSLPATIHYADFTRAIKGIKPGSMVPYRADVGVSVDAPMIGRLRLPLKKEGQLTIPTLADLKEFIGSKIISPTPSSP